MSYQRPLGLSSHIFVTDVTAAVAFYRDVFGAVELFRQTMADGTVLFVELRQLTGIGSAERDGGDPLHILLPATHQASAQVARAASDALRDRETIAIETATPTPGGHELIRAARESGRRVAIVSNNSDQAVVAYLHHHDLADFVDEVSARAQEQLLRPQDRGSYRRPALATDRRRRGPICLACASYMPTRYTQASLVAGASDLVCAPDPGTLSASPYTKHQRPSLPSYLR